MKVSKEYNIIMFSIPGFKLYTKKNNAIHYGLLYQKTMNLPFSRFPKRTLHVWVPEDYDGKKRYGVIYFADAQNMVDHYQTAYGEWNMEDRIHERMDKGFDGYILAGLSCALSENERVREYTPAVPTNKRFLERYKCKRVFGDKYADYMVNVIKPLVDSHFMTIKDKTGFCGSSMGGLISSYIGCKYSDIFKFIISYSPAYFVYHNKDLLTYIKKWNPTQGNIPIFIIYMGYGDKLEKQLYPSTQFVVKQLRTLGFKNNEIYYTENLKAIHHEKAWYREMKRTLLFLSKKGF